MREEFFTRVKTEAEALPELVKRLDARLLPALGTDVLLSKIEFAGGEWELDLGADGHPELRQTKEFEQRDEHLVVTPCSKCEQESGEGVLRYGRIFVPEVSSDKKAGGKSKDCGKRRAWGS